MSYSIPWVTKLANQLHSYALISPKMLLSEFIRMKISKYITMQRQSTNLFAANPSGKIHIQKKVWVHSLFQLHEFTKTHGYEETPIMLSFPFLSGITHQLVSAEPLLYKP
jgi:hypothetical protein